MISEKEVRTVLGIVDVGGGTRDIFGAGLLDYFMDMDLHVDYFIGVSAGSANGISYLAGQRGRNYKFYADYVFRREYMGLGQLFRTGSIINLDYGYGKLSNRGGEYPIDYPAFAKDATTFEVVATDADTGKPVYFNRNHICQDDYDVLKASSCVPVVCRSYRIGNFSYYDGGISDPIPFKRAFARGCDRLVVILTRPKTLMRSGKTDRAYARFLKYTYPQAARKLANRGYLYNRQLRQLQKLEEEGRVLIAAPNDISGLKTLTRDLEKLDALYHEGYASGKAAAEFLWGQRPDFSSC